MSIRVETLQYNCEAFNLRNFLVFNQVKVFMVTDLRTKTSSWVIMGLVGLAWQMQAQTPMAPSSLLQP